MKEMVFNYSKVGSTKKVDFFGFGEKMAEKTISSGTVKKLYQM